MDKRCLLLLLSLSLLLGFLQALRCHRCYRVGPDGSCEHQRTICNAKQDEECLVKKYYSGDKFFRGYQDCRETCTNMTSVQGPFKIVIACCKGKDLCNVI